MSYGVDDLLEILNLETLEHNLFRGKSPNVGWQRVFGGQVIGQALVAASRTVEDRSVHSLHCYFMRPGDPKVPIIYDVDKIRDGRSFTTRRVVAIQHGKPIFSLSASFQIAEDGYDHQIDMPDIPQPEDLPNETELKEKYLAFAPQNVKDYWSRPRPIEVRPVSLEHYVSNKKLEPAQHIWIRTTSPVPDDQLRSSAVLAYFSDMTLLDTSLYAHGTSIFDQQLQVASLDHAMWFHRKADFSDWILYTQDSPSASGARGFTRGSLYTRSGTLIASVAQEGLIRRREGEENIRSFTTQQDPKIISG
ncbi:MAG: acyl-CoA thioesterase II [Hyphomicrobiales bacterium]